MTSSLKLRDFRSEALAKLTGRYEIREARWIVRSLLEDVMGWSSTDIILRDDYEFLPHTYDKLMDMVSRVAGGEPVQYVTGKAPFYGMTFKVTPAVLIPRPETAELVDIIVSENSARQDLKVLDCGTGSGCIAIALARNLPFSQVTAIDISAGALDVARENAKDLRAHIEFKQQDILRLSSDNAPGQEYDIIVSNPPYIAMKEKNSMESHVLDYEPHRALFVSDDDPVMFYRAIARYALAALVEGGRLYFEINPDYVEDVLALLSSFDDVAALRDSQGRMRFVTARKRHDM